MAAAIYSAGTPVWLDDRERGWLPARVESARVEGAHVALSVAPEDASARSPRAVRVAADDVAGGPPLRNAPAHDDAPDLAALPHLNEPSILHVIRARYAQRKIYTYSGIVLLAVNPFAPVPLYGPDAVRAYADGGTGAREARAPHLFAIAGEAFAAMAATRRSQTVIISGESGAGKTESAKYIMRYLASVTGGSGTVEAQILATNPILEAFGNAQTARNDNSSRFGKHVQILFDAAHGIVGAQVRTYLLERARIAAQQPGERNYHIFYQLCAGASPAERARLRLDRPAGSFAYLAASAPSGARDADEAAGFTATRRALSTVGIGAPAQLAIFEVLAGLLHLGDIGIRAARDAPDAVLDAGDAALAAAAELLGLDAKAFAKWTGTKHFAARGENIRSVRTAAQARGVRDGVAKFVYAALFDWLVVRVNASFGADGGAARAAAFIAVLDIYGFEHFATNSFEQFCINYANEKLQQQFTAHVFKLQQAEYAAENIDWRAIAFADNAPTLALIEGRLGLLAILDEESRLAAGTDASFVEKLAWTLLAAPAAAPAKAQTERIFRATPDSFTVAHYAHSVEYSVEGFLEKNRGTVPDEHMDLLLGSTNAFVREIVELAAGTAGATLQPVPAGAERPTTPTNRPSTPVRLRPTTPHGPSAPAGAVRGHVRNLTATPAPPTTPGRGGAATSRKPTQCSVFKTSLRALTDTLAQTDIHYVRCIKPNARKAAWALDGAAVAEQLRACGVLETVRISTSGYPGRAAYGEFAARYGPLLPRDEARAAARGKEYDARRTAVAVLARYMPDEAQYKLGRTKVFFRSRVLAVLEGLRHEVEARAALTLQCAWRSTVARHELAWLREEREEQERLEAERLEAERAEEEERQRREEEYARRAEEEARQHRVRASVDTADRVAIDALSLRLDAASLRDMPAIPDSPTLTPSSPRSPRRPPSLPSPRSPHFKATATPPPGSGGRPARAFSPLPAPAFGYQQATQSSARKHVHVQIADGVDGEHARGREHLHAESSESGSARARSRAASRDTVRARARSREPGKEKENVKERGGAGNALTRLMGAKERGAGGKRKDGKEKDGARAGASPVPGAGKEKERSRMFGWRLGRSAARAAAEQQTRAHEGEDVPPLPPKPPKPPAQDNAPLPIYAKFASRSTPWYLEAQA